MKIITEDAIYVMLNDIAYLNQTDIPIPASIYLKTTGKRSLVVNNSNRYDFIRFEAPEEIDFFRSQDWIIDYDDVKDLSDEEIIALGKSTIAEKNAIVHQYNSMNSKEKEQNKNMRVIYDLLNHKMYSIRDFLWFKQGHLKIQLPEGITPPSGPKKRNGIKLLLRTIFKRK